MWRGLRSTDRASRRKRTTVDCPIPASESPLLGSRSSVVESCEDDNVVQYIVQRLLTKNKGRKVGDEIIVRSQNPQSTQFRELRYDFDKLVEQGCASEERFKLMKKLIPKWRDEFEVLTSIPTVDDHNSNKEENDVDKERRSIDSLSTVNDVPTFVNKPSHCCPKGCGERLKTRMEKIMSKPRLCRACDKRGVQHDTQNCPDKRKWVEENEDNDQNISDEES